MQGWALPHIPPPPNHLTPVLSQTLMDFVSACGATKYREGLEWALEAIASGVLPDQKASLFSALLSAWSKQELVSV